MSPTRCLLSAALAAAFVPYAHAQGTSLIAESSQVLDRHPALARSPFAIIVRHNAGEPESHRAALRRLVGDGGFETIDEDLGLELVRIQVPVDEALARLRPHVRYAEPDLAVRASGVPNDPRFDEQYALRNVGQAIQGALGTPGADIIAVPAWTSYTGDPDFAVAVIDSGVDYTHADLAANIWTNSDEIPGNGIDDDQNGYVDDIRGWDFFQNDADPMDANGHGTHVSGTIGARGNNGVGVAGVNWRCSIVPLRFLGPSGNGSLSAAVKAIRYCRTNNIKVSNNSWGLLTLPAYAPQSLSDVIKNTQVVGHLFCAAAGNDVNDNDGVLANYPSSYPLGNIIAVAATDNRDELAWFSNWGATSVDLAAPGYDILSTWPGNQYTYASGTSMATPHVAGVVAMAYSLQSGLGYAQIRANVLAAVRPVASLSGRCATGGVVSLGGVLGTLPPPPPSQLAVTGVSNTTVQLTWHDNAGDESAYRVAKLDPGEDPNNFAHWDNVGGDLPANTQAFTVLGLLPNSTYQFKVRCENVHGLSLYSNVVVTTTSNALPPTPTGLVATGANQDTIWLAWHDNASDEIAYKVAKLDAGEDPNDPAAWDNVGGNLQPNTEAFAVGGLLPNATYQFKVRCENAVGFSPYSNVISASTYCPVPADPTGLTLTNVGTGAVMLGWQDNANNEDAYRVARLDPGEDPNNPAHWDNVGGDLLPNTTSFLATGLANNATYCFKLRAKNACGFSNYSPVGCITTVCPPPPSPVLGVASVTCDTVSLSWQDNASDEIAYRVAKLDPGEDPNNPAHWDNVGGDLPANTTSFLVGGLTTGGTYLFKVRCENACAFSAYSNVVSATPSLPGAPAAPTNCDAYRITTTSNPDPVRIDWSHVSPCGVSGFRVARLDPGEDPNNPAHWDNVGGDLPACTTTYLDTTVTQNGKVYQYKVRAFVDTPCGKVFSAYSNSNGATP